MSTNVVVIVADALRVDRVGAFGGRELTPHIDGFASESVVFSNSYTTSNATDVAVTSIQTGRYPLSHGVVNHGERVSDAEKRAVESVTQLPEALSEAAYRTAKFGRPLGRWHRNGFDRYPSQMERRAAFDEDRDSESIKQRVADTLEAVHPELRSLASTVYQLRNQTVDKQALVAEYENSEDSVVQNFEEFLQGSSPFYSFVHLMDTHTPYRASPEVVRSHLEYFDYNTDLPMCEVGTHPESFDSLVRQGAYPEIREKYYLSDGTPTTAVTDAHYDATVTQADQRVGQILDCLKREGLYDDSLIVFLSDHGESLTEHGIYYDHHGLYDVTTHVPLIVRPPGGDRHEVTDFTQITDIAPTIADYVGTDGIDADGVSLRPVIEDGASVDRQYVFAEEAHTQRRRMVRSEEQKLIYSLDADRICRYCGVQHAPPLELYDLVDDSAERHNVAASREDSVNNLRNRGEEMAEKLEQRTTRNGGEHVMYEDEDEVEARLEALGYK
jgi:arylsulfatase A-like enzyme